MGGKKEDDVNVSDLTLRDSKGEGVRGCHSASVHLDNVSVENSGKQRAERALNIQSSLGPFPKLDAHLTYYIHTYNYSLDISDVD